MPPPLTFNELKEAEDVDLAFKHLNDNYCRICGVYHKKVKLYLIKYNSGFFYLSTSTSDLVVSLCNRDKNKLLKHYLGSSIKEIIELSDQDIFTLKIICP